MTNVVPWSPPDAGMRRAIRYYETPIVGAAFHWTPAGHRDWCRRAGLSVDEKPETVSELASLLKEFHAHIRDEAMADAWASRKKAWNDRLDTLIASDGAVVAVAPPSAPPHFTHAQWLALYKWFQACASALGQDMKNVTMRQLASADLPAAPEALAGLSPEQLRGHIGVLQAHNSPDLLGVLASFADMHALRARRSVPAPAHFPAIDAPADAVALQASQLHRCCSERVSAASKFLYAASKGAVFNHYLAKQRNLVTPSGGGIHDVIICRTEALAAADKLRRGTAGQRISTASGSASGSAAAPAASSSSAAATSAALEQHRSKLFFSQLCAQLSGVTGFKLRRNGQAFKVRVVGEGGHDVGGLYRDLVSSVCSELQSPLLPLLVQTPDDGASSTWLPNPAAVRPHHVEQWEVVGVLMGIMAKDEEGSMNLDWNPVVWKALVGQPLDTADVAQVSKSVHAQIMALRSPDTHALTAVELEDVLGDLTYTVASADGSSVELFPGGASTTVPAGAASLNDLAARMQAHVFGEFSVAVAAMRRGFSRVVPLRVVATLLTPKELQLRVSGVADISIPQLRRHTLYRGMSASDPHVDMLWRVLEDDFTAAERAQFLQYVWGRQRLPVGDNWGNVCFKLTPHGSSRGKPQAKVDTYLPVAHTCFFQLELPSYSSKDVMRDKLRYAVAHGRAIDADDTSEGAANAALEF